MQNSDESMVKVKAKVKAMNAIVAQVKAIAEEFQIAESVAFRIIEDALAAAAAICDWDLSASGEAQGTGCKRQDSGECGHKCGEGACKAKEEAQAPVPVSKPAAPEAAPKTAYDPELGKVYIPELGKIAKSLRAMELEAAPEATDEIWVGSQNCVTIPLRIIKLAEGINGTLNSKRHKFGALTVIKRDDKVTVLFGDKSAEHKGASVVHLNRNGQAKFCVSPAFTDGDAVKCSLLKDGTIILTYDEVANMDGTIALTTLIGE